MRNHDHRRRRGESDQLVEGPPWKDVRVEVNRDGLAPILDEVAQEDRLQGATELERVVEKGEIPELASPRQIFEGEPLHPFERGARGRRSIDTEGIEGGPRVVSE